MEKLTLNPDLLRVQSFAATPDARPAAGLPRAAFTRPQICDPLTVVHC